MRKRIEDLLTLSAAEYGTDISAEKLERFIAFADELKKWNRKINLTSITGDSDIVVKHFADSISLLKVMGGDGSLLDVGSGGGFPSIPLKIMLPTLSIVSVDAVEKKILFQRHVARVLGLEDFHAVHARCEDLSKEYAGHFDWIVSRAFSDIPAFVKIALPFLKKNGRIIAMKGKRGGEEAASAISGLAETGVMVAELMDFKLPITGDFRSLVIMKKVAD